MRLHFLVEGPSEEAFLSIWLRRFLPSGHTFKIITHQGKGRLPRDPSRPPEAKHRGLLDQLPAKLRAYGKLFNPDTDRIIVLLDLDDDDCQDLKSKLLGILEYCDPKPMVLFRLAIEETESFFLGDAAAIKKAYPKARIGKLKRYEHDSICGAWETLREVIGVSKDNENKVSWAETIAAHLGVEWRGRRANKSPSFRQFCRGILRLSGETVDH